MKLRGKRQGNAVAEEAPPPNLKLPAGTTPAWLPGSVEVDVAGVHYHLEALQAVRAHEAGGRPLVAVLMPEPANRHDPNPVAVYVEGSHIGFLHAPTAKRVQPAILQYQKRTGRPVAAPATIIDHYQGPAVVLALDPAPLGLHPESFENIPEMALVLQEKLSALDRAQPVMNGQDQDARVALAQAERDRQEVDANPDRSPRAWQRLEREFRDLANRLVSAGDPTAGPALLGLARCIRYQAGRRDDTLSAFIESLFYDRTNEEAWFELTDYASISPHVKTLVALMARCPFQSRRPLIDEFLGIAEGHDRNGRMLAADGVKLRRELNELCERQGYHEGIAFLVGLDGLQAEKDGDLDRAVSLWRKAIQHGGTDPHVADRFSTWLVKTGEVAEAARVLRPVLSSREVPETLRQRMEKRLERAERHK